MQKIRIKKNKVNRLVFENISAPKLKVKLFEDEQFVANASSFEETCKKMFKAECAKMHLNVGLQIPTSFDSISPGLRKAPIDLKAVMQNLTATEMETFKNTDNMMPDPVDTFDAAEDFAVSAFSNLPEKMKITPKSEDADLSKEDKDGDRSEEEQEGVELVSLGLNYDHINEGEAGAVAGDIASKVAAGGVKAAGQVLGGIAAGAAPAMVGATAAGMVAGANTAAVPSSHIDDSRFENRKDAVKTNQSGDEGTKYKGTNAIEAISVYVDNVTEAVALLAAQLGASDDAVGKFKKEVGLLIKHNDEKGVQYLSNDALTKEIKGEQDEKDKNRLRNINSVRQIQNKLLQGMAMAGLYDEELVNEIDKIKNYESAEKVRKKLLATKEVTAKNNAKDFIENISLSDITGVKISENRTYEYQHFLNEDEEVENDESTTIKAEDDVYTPTLEKLKELCKNLVPKNGKDFPGYADAKARMDNLALEANKSITEKIDEICKVGQGESDMSAKVSKFLSNHPLNAKGLKEVWSRYYEELNHRRDQRLKAMQDLSKTTYSQGWTCNIITMVVPRTLAKMLTYRYILKLLKDKKVYSYTTLQLKKEEELWEEKKGEMMKGRSNLVGVIWVGNNSKLTNDDKSVMSIDEDGKVVINGNLPYLGLYLSQLKNSGNLEINNLIESFDSHNGDEFIQKMYEGYVSVGYGRTLTSSTTNACKVLGKTFDVSLKTEYGDAYDALSKLSLSTDTSIVAATMKFIGLYANSTDSLTKLNEACNTSIKDKIAHKDFQSILTYLINDFGASIDTCLLDLNINCANLLIKAMHFDSAKDDVYSKIKEIKIAILAFDGSGTESADKPDFLYLAGPETEEILSNLQKIISIAASGFLDNAAKKIMGEKKVQLQVCDLYNAYHAAFYTASPDTEKLANLYSTDASLGITKKAIDNLVADSSFVDSSVKDALSKIQVDPASLFDKPTEDPYKNASTFAAFVDGNAFNAGNPDNLDNISEDASTAAYATLLTNTAGAALKELITAYGVDDAKNFLTVWPELHKVAAISVQLVKDIETANKTNKINGQNTASIIDACDELKKWIETVNNDKAFEGIDNIIDILAITENYYKDIVTNDKLMSYLPAITSLETDQAKWATSWGKMKTVVNNIDTAFNPQNK